MLAIAFLSAVITLAIDRVLPSWADGWPIGVVALGLYRAEVYVEERWQDRRAVQRLMTASDSGPGADRGTIG